MQYILSYFITTSILFIICTGCSSYTKTEKNVNSDNSKIINTFCENTKNSFSDNIDDYYIERNNDKPLSINYLSDGDYTCFLITIEGYMRMNSDQFQITYLENWCSAVSFRKISVENKTYFYCIFCDNDNGEKAFLFFEKFDDMQTYRCIKYITLNGENIIEYPDDSEDLYTHIFDIDL